MARQIELSGHRKALLRLEPWIWPLTAAVVMGGSVVFWSLAAMFWLAARPAPRTVVVWMPAAAEQSVDETAAAPRFAVTEIRPDVRTD